VAGRMGRASPYTRAVMTTGCVLAVCAAAAAQNAAPIPASEVTLRHEIHRDARATVFLLTIPPAEATLEHRHDRDMLSVFVNGGRTRASFNGAMPVEDLFRAGDVRFRQAGFTHSTENLGDRPFLSVIFEFTDSQGPRVPATRPATHICNAGSKTACVDRKPLFCTNKFCVDDVTMGPQATTQVEASRQAQMFVAVSDYSLAEQIGGTAAIVHAKKSGEVEHVPAGRARHWTSTSSTASRFIVVSFQ
jgi:uncharacterized RmlC-like cupin family protein